MAKSSDDLAPPNPDIDNAIKALMARITPKPGKNGEPAEAIPPDVAVKIINTAISWEKVKHQIKDSDTEFDPDRI